MGIGYAVEKLGAAVHHAMQSTESLQQRLVGCCLNFRLLSYHDHLPPDLKERFDAIMTACAREPDPTGSRGAIEATMAKMDTQEASQWLNKIQSLYEDIIARANSGS